MHPIWKSLALCSILSIAALAAPATQPVDSPLAALKAQDAAARDGNLQTDLSFYQASGEAEQKLAQSIAAGDVALGKHENAVATRFGDELAAAVVHAAGSESLADLRSAIEKIEGTHATIVFRADLSTVAMVKVDQHWKISLADWVNGARPRTTAQLGDMIEKLTRELNRLTTLVEKNRFRSGEGVRDRIEQFRQSLLSTQ